ncbi:MAG: S-methyl-5-thioribose-1-phosphate isomerase [candidate division WOR-3 bacterium]|nr:MAG: S-methyl-5-thioribose-1-phosphate isomerase [candidate division WOR-3 bacterium]
MPFRTIRYDPDKNSIIILDQTRLPQAEVYMTLENVEDVHRAIRCMNLRGAPLIGVAAAYGVAMAARTGIADEAYRACDLLQTARPTAVNLSWALNRMREKIKDTADLSAVLMEEAHRIEKEDKDACHKIGLLGASLVKNNDKIMVHCNAGALATSGIGTALGIIYAAKEQGKNFTVYSNETRPLLQGARLTSWELTRSGIETYTICDNMAATFMAGMNMVLVGADRIAANGDVANKIGTLGLAIIARYHQIPFYVAAPTSTFDRKLASGEQIPIEERAEDEIRIFNDRCIVATSARVINPSFDVTPADLISGIVTEQRILAPPYTTSIAELS